MTTDIKELVKRLRDGDCLDIGAAADAIEAMAAEVERYREAHKGFMILQAALERVLGERRVAIAERDRLELANARLAGEVERLKGVLGEISRQKTTDELNKWEHWDFNFEEASDAAIKKARSALEAKP